ncbi:MULTISPECIES: hypothetical protein [unclassified Streptomyces]|uniref:hypothetical protein n=1 Tax=unclassified Streptomyces TaxID=2593676 RepID=UPI000A7D140D|nr:hypothetical protein [Streptomyces sp. TSRI0107]
MAFSDGYQVKNSGMTGQAKELDGSGTDMGKVREAIAPGVCYTSDALGGTDAAAAVNGFITAWEAEARTLESALHELADKVRLAKGAYGGSDGLVRMDAAGVKVADGELTSMPAFTGNEQLTTMPTYAERPSALTSY